MLAPPAVLWIQIIVRPPPSLSLSSLSWLPFYHLHLLHGNILLTFIWVQLITFISYFDIPRLPPRQPPLQFRLWAAHWPSTIPAGGVLLIEQKRFFLFQSGHISCFMIIYCKRCVFHSLFFFYFNYQFGDDLATPVKIILKFESFFFFLSF